jgi:hypothetical protein
LVLNFIITAIACSNINGAFVFNSTIFKINRKFTIPLSTIIIIPMSEFLIYFQIGLKHVLDIHAYDHVLFLALFVPFSFKDWKRITFNNSFTIGHIALLLSVFGVIPLK